MSKGMKIQSSFQWKGAGAKGYQSFMSKIDYRRHIICVITRVFNSIASRDCWPFCVLRASSSRACQRRAFSAGWECVGREKNEENGEEKKKSSRIKDLFSGPCHLAFDLFFLYGFSASLSPSVFTGIGSLLLRVNLSINFEDAISRSCYGYV